MIWTVVTVTCVGPITPGKCYEAVIFNPYPLLTKKSVQMWGCGSGWRPHLNNRLHNLQFLKKKKISILPQNILKENITDNYTIPELLGVRRASWAWLTPGWYPFLSWSMTWRCQRETVGSNTNISFDIVLEVILQIISDFMHVLKLNIYNLLDSFFVCNLFSLCFHT